MRFAPDVEDLAEPLPLLGKAAMIGEILVTYVRAQRLLRTKNLNEILAEYRAPNGKPPRMSLEARREHAAAVRLGRAVTRTLHPLPTDTRCLVRALVLARLLARRDVECAVVIGVASSPKFKAHAWVEHLGYAVLPTGSTYDRLAEF